MGPPIMQMAFQVLFCLILLLGLTTSVVASQEASTGKVDVPASCCAALASRYKLFYGYPESSVPEAQKAHVIFFQSERLPSQVPQDVLTNPSHYASACVFVPETAEQIAEVLVLSDKLDCLFSVSNSGGHFQYALANHVHCGWNSACQVQIDLSLFDAVDVLPKDGDGPDRVLIGAGNSWGGVYQKLDTKGVTVPGARVDSDVVSLLLGGGTSFYSAQYGWACDNILEYHVVLANGTLIEVTESKHQDLFVALKGGGQNFGIVTEVVMRSYPVDKLWGGLIVNPIDTTSQQTDALYHFGEKAGEGKDLQTSILQMFNFRSSLFTAVQSSSVLNFVVNTAGIVNPPILANFTKITPVLKDSRKMATMSGLVAGLSPGGGFGKFEQTGVMTVKNDPALLAKAVELFKEAIDSSRLPSEKAELNTILGLQPMHKQIFKASQQMGLNSLGLSPEDGNLVWVVPVVASDDVDSIPLIRRIMDKFLADITTEAKAKSSSTPCSIYLSYAYEFTYPFGSYSWPINHPQVSILSALAGSDYKKGTPEDFLKTVAARYDPARFFLSHLIGPHLLINEQVKGDIKAELKKAKKFLPAFWGNRFEEKKDPNWNAHLGQAHKEL